MPWDCSSAIGKRAVLEECIRPSTTPSITPSTTPSTTRSARCSTSEARRGRAAGPAVRRLTLLPGRARAHGLCLLLLPFLLGGCKAERTALEQRQQQTRALAQSESAARASLAAIPPPSKHLYLDVRSADAWQNPFLTVRRDSLTLRIMFPQQTTSALDAGTMLHPAAARRQELEVRLKDLPEALSAVPDYAWPYGRVVAIQEAPTHSREDRVQIRRNEEQAIGIVNSLDIVVDEWTSPAGGSLLH